MYAAKVKVGLLLAKDAEARAPDKANSKSSHEPELEAVAFSAGNPRVEHISGIVHLFREVPANNQASVPLPALPVSLDTATCKYIIAIRLLLINVNHKLFISTTFSLIGLAFNFPIEFPINCSCSTMQSAAFSQACDLGDRKSPGFITKIVSIAAVTWHRLQVFTQSPWSIQRYTISYNLYRWWIGYVYTYILSWLGKTRLPFGCPQWHENCAIMYQAAEFYANAPSRLSA